jgi:3,4-dihydroxy 2-butanone 4-phosphate synthase/GTP cyclohydrolase II
VRQAREAPSQPMLRDYGIGAQILADLGVTDIIRLSNHPRPLVGLEGWGLRVVETRPLAGEKQR